MTMARRYEFVFVLLLAAAAQALAPPGLHAQARGITLEPFVSSSLNQPVLLTNAHDGTDRRFIVEQPGRISVVRPGSSTRTTFLDLTARVVCCGERGLLGLTFHPQFATNRRFFVNYTRRPDGATVIAEYQASPSNPDIALTTETVLLVINQPYENHNGGMVEFGPDGYLYIGMGDGGSGNDPQNRAQNVDELLGKMLRIDVDSPAGGVPYSSPPNNPFVNTSGRDEIFALGLRNPWRFSFDRATGQLYVGDVGQNAREEIDIVTLGGNYGWRVMEGTGCTNLGPASCTAPGFIPPITEYENNGNTGGRCSVTGGYVYRGSQQALPFGAYVFADYCTGEIFMFNAGMQSRLLDTPLNITSFGEDEAGEIYVVGQGGSIFRIANPDILSGPIRTFSLGQSGTALSWVTEVGSSLTSGYAEIQADVGSTVPAGFAVLGLRQNGVLVSEASVTATPQLLSGRIYAEMSNSVKTGIAISNPNAQPVTLSFYFTDSNGSNMGQGTTTIGAGRQIAVFLNESPFQGSNNFRGTFTFTASELVSAYALRGFTTGRGEFSISNVPVAGLDALAFAQRPPLQTIPQFADGAGWRTSIVLVNTTDTALSGELKLYDSAGGPLPIALNGSTNSTFSYSVTPRSASVFQSAASSASVRVGSVQIIPSGASSLSPSSFAILRYAPDAVRVTEASVPAVMPGTAWRIFVESLGEFDRAAAGSMQTAVAIANPSGNSINVQYELIPSSATAATQSGSISIPANGQVAVFANQLPGITSSAAPFQGTLRIDGTASGVVVMGLRARINERSDFLISSTEAVSDAVTPPSNELFIPYFAMGAGYGVQFVLFSRSASPVDGTVYFFDREGRPLNVLFR